jgi:hypothetical protein
MVIDPGIFTITNIKHNFKQKTIQFSGSNAEIEVLMLLEINKSSAVSNFPLN